jgi:hypothetical protein
MQIETVLVAPHSPSAKGPPHHDKAQHAFSKPRRCECKGSLYQVASRPRLQPPAPQTPSAAAAAANTTSGRNSHLLKPDSGHKRNPARVQHQPLAVRDTPESIEPLEFAGGPGKRKTH